MSPFLSLCFALFACEEAPPPQSTPVPQTAPENNSEPLTVPVGKPASKPVQLDKLALSLPGFSDLNLEAKQAVSSALNLNPAPCEACEGKSIAHCIVGAGSCGVVAKLGKRAVRLARDGRPSEMIKVAVNYPDLWFQGLGEGTPVSIHLYRDPQGPFTEDTEGVRGRMVGIFGKEINITLHDDMDENTDRLGVRNRPTWFINGHRFRGVQSVNALGRFVTYELSDQ